MKIFKYDIPPLGAFTIDMPEGAQVLCVQAQRGEPKIWAMVDPKAPPTRRSFLVFGTGAEISDRAAVRYIGTIQMEGGALVWHLFEALV